MGKRLKFIDLTYLNSMSGGSEEIVIEMLGIFLEQLPEFREKFSKALKINDMKMLSDVAHKAKSSMAILGIEDVRARLAHLEKSIKEGVNHEIYVSEAEYFLAISLDIENEVDVLYHAKK